jgi:trk system potassium uptake protein TrkH
MNIKLVLKTLGKLILLIAGCMTIPLAMAFYNHTNDRIPFLIATVITLLIGLSLKYIFISNDTTFSFREAFAISAFGWTSVGFVSAIPMFITDYFGYQSIFGTIANEFPYSHSILACFSNCFFESMSGYSGTGASVISRIEDMPHPLLFWRCFHNGLGGMGILVLFVAILPSLGSAGSKLFKSESSLSSADSSIQFPKVASLAKSLWLIYASMTIIVCVSLMIAGMSLFDASCHAFSVMGTGGFSTKNTSIAAFNSVPIETMLFVFMFLGSLNCLLLRSLITGKIKDVFSNTEFRVFFILVLGSIVAVTTVNYLNSFETSLLKVFRDTSFTIMSIASSTGYATADFDQWPHFSKMLLIILMIIGGCASSTAGGIKVMRIVIVAKFIQREFKKMIRPHGVFPIIIQDTVVENKTAEAAVGYCLLFFATLLGFSALIALFENDVVASFSGILTCLSNMGPGFESVGPTDNFANFSSSSKVIMGFCMALGRLEMMAFFVLLSPKIWKK